MITKNYRRLYFVILSLFAIFLGLNIAFMGDGNVDFRNDDNLVIIECDALRDLSIDYWPVKLTTDKLICIAGDQLKSGNDCIEESEASGYVVGFSFGLLKDMQLSPITGCSLVEGKLKLEIKKVENSHGNGRIGVIALDSNSYKFNLRRGISIVSCPYTGYVSFFKISGDNTDGRKYIWLPISCKDPNNPYEILKDKGITENSVLFKVDDEKPLALSYQGESLSGGGVAASINGDIVSRTAEDLILEATVPDWQPQFVDIALLQLKSISYLTNKLATIDSGFDIKDVLTITSYSGYQNVLGKIRFDTRLATADDIYQPLTLKDVGILAQIQDGLLKRVVLGVAGTIDISHDPYDPMDNYTLAELQNILKTDLALSKSLVNFNFTQLTGYDSLSGESWYEDFDKLVKMWKGELQDNDAFLVGLQQNLRKSNIDFLLDKADTQRLNLLGIYNGYYEVLQVVKGDAYAKLLKDVIDAPDQADSYLETLVNMLNFEADEMGINGFLDGFCNLFSFIRVCGN